MVHTVNFTFDSDQLAARLQSARNTITTISSNEHYPVLSAFLDYLPESGRHNLACTVDLCFSADNSLEELHEVADWGAEFLKSTSMYYSPFT